MTRSSVPVTVLLCKCLICLLSGSGMKLNPQGIMTKHTRYTNVIPMEAVIPNSTRIWLEVTMKVAKPAAVVKLLRNEAFPIFWIIRCKALILFPWRSYSAWNLLIMNTKFGIHITINRGGNMAVSSVILMPSMAITPTVQLTQISTINKQKPMMRKERKNR